jgi:D-alanyl-D-alanine carboxypeptidase
MSDRPAESRRTGHPLCNRRWVAALSVLALAGGLSPLPANASEADTAQRGNAVQRSLEGLVHDDKFPAALASVRGRDGRTRDYTAGVGDLETGAKVPVDGQVRIASNTKMFTATVVLQLVGEGRIDLDAPIETYLPNIVRGDGIDGRNITVHQLLQHTSGLADYDDVLAQNYLAAQHTYFEPRDLLDVTLAKKALFAPGTGWSYSNGNYVLAGLIVQKVTGRPIGEEITKRIIDRIGLRHTYWPALGDQSIREAHAHGYFPRDSGGALADVTEMEPSMAWAAGQLIATPSDLNRFLTALLNGELLRPEQLAQMKTTVDAPDFDTVGGARYGLGLGTFKLSCGGFAWTHGGNAPGYVTRNAVTPDGRAAAVAVTALPTTLPAAQHVEAALDTALCK